MATYIAGVEESAWKRLKSLPRRKLLPTDIPNEAWRDAYAEYELREDGAIISQGMSIELGWIHPESGTINWLR